MSILKLTDKNFEEEVIKNEGTVIVDFYAEWCGPCKMMSKVIDELAEELERKVIVGKVNCDENIKLVEQFEIMSIPVIMIFKNGKLTKKFVGYTEKDEIKENI